MAQFEIATEDNSQRITLNDNSGNAPSDEWIIGTGSKAIGWAVLSYAKLNGLDPRDVGYSVRPV